MAIPTVITDLSTTASSNSPTGGESPVDGDNYIRALSAFIAQNYANKADKASPTFTGTVTADVLTTTGNTTLGNATTDVVDIGAGCILKDANRIVGINVTPSAWINGATAIQTSHGSFGSLPSGPVDHVFLAANAYGTGSLDPGSTTWKYKATGAAVLGELSGGGATWKVAASGAAAATISWTTVFQLSAAGEVHPGADNSQTLGTAAKRWSVVYAGTGTINTSDARDKEAFADLTAAERAVGLRCKALIKRFKFQDATAIKGERARIHFGITAQDVRDAFQAEGLNPRQYGVFCEDTWFEKTVNGRIETSETDSPGAVQRSRMGIRYEELLTLIVASM